MRTDKASSEMIFGRIASRWRDVHGVVKVGKRLVEMNHATRLDYIRERFALYASEGMSAGDETDHLLLSKTLTLERGYMLDDSFIWQGYSASISDGCVYSAASVINLRAPASYIRCQYTRDVYDPNNTHQCSTATTIASAKTSATYGMMGVNNMVSVNIRVDSRDAYLFDSPDKRSTVS